MGNGNAEKKPRRRRNLITGILFIFFAGVFVFSLYQLFTAHQAYQLGTDTYDGLAQSVVVKPKPEVHLPVPEAPQPDAPTIIYERLLEVDFEALKAINSDTVAWIYSENEEINYPVVQGEDNDYYLNHLIDGKKNMNGSIFMDCRNSPDLEDRNTLIYGHNMGNHEMFYSLTKYKNKGYYEENPVLILSTPEKDYYLQVFSGYTTKSVSEAYRQDLDSDTIYENFLMRIRESSDFVSDVEVTAEDRIVTLSTCSYAFNDARYVLHCKLVPAVAQP